MKTTGKTVAGKTVRVREAAPKKPGKGEGEA